MTVHPVRNIQSAYIKKSKSPLSDSLKLRRQAGAIAHAEPGDTMDTAVRIQPFKQAMAAYTDSVGAIDADMYRFKLRKRTNVSVFVNNEGGGSFKASLIGGMGQMLNQTISDSASPETVGATIYKGKLNKGTYFVRLDFTQSLNPDIAYKLYFEKVLPVKPDKSSGGSSNSGGGSSGGSGGSSSGSGKCNFPTDRASDGSLCGGRAASERPGGR